MSKKSISKLLVLLILLIVLPTMTGCGGCGFAGEGGDNVFFTELSHYDDDKQSGSAIKVSGLAATGGIGKLFGMLKKPLVVFGAGPVPGSKVTGAQFKVNIAHFVGHFAAALTGGGDDCGDVHECDAGDYAINIQPLNMAATALNIGRTIGGVVGNLRGIAIAILVTVWFGNMLTNIIREQFAVEGLLKSLMQLLIGALLVMNADDIAGAFLGLFTPPAVQGNTTVFGEIAMGRMANAQYLVIALGVNVPIIQAGIPFGYLFIDNLPVIAAVVCGSIIVILAEVQCAVAVCSALIPIGIELGLRLQIAPIIFAMGTGSGWDQSTLGYLKSCIACAMTPAIVAAIVGQAGAIEQLARGPLGDSLLGRALAISIGYKIMSGFVGQARSLVSQAFH